MAEAIDLFDDTSDDQHRAWHRQSRTNPAGKRFTESKPAFEAWRAYARLMEKRSIRKVAQQLDKSTTLIGRWSVAWKWQERVRAWDDFVSEQENAAFIKERLAMARRQANVAVIGQNAATRALVELDAGIQAGTVKLKPMEIAKLLCDTARLERENRGKPDPDAVASITVVIQPRARPRYETEGSDQADYDA